VECKYGKRIAPWTLFKSTEVLAKRELKTPVLCLKQAGETGFLIVCRDSDIEAVYQAWRTAHEQGQGFEGTAGATGTEAGV
jgi:hypothetical protein